MKTETIIRFERNLLRTDGTTLPVEVSASPMRHGYFQTVVRDISERKRSEAALAQAFKEIQTLKDHLQTENIALRDEVDRVSMFEEIVGTSTALQDVLSRIAKVSPDKLHSSDHRRDWDGQGTHRARCSQTVPEVRTRLCQRELCRPGAIADFLGIIRS